VVERAATRYRAYARLVGDCVTAKRCPKCLRMIRVLPEETARGCSLCGRWQFLFQSPFVTFAGAVHQHLACVCCGEGAWCRDMVDGIGDAAACARDTHMHPPGPCIGPKAGELLPLKR